MTPTWDTRYVLDANDEPVIEPDLVTWARWFESANRMLGFNIVGDVRLVTQFMGINLHPLPSTLPPKLWETQIWCRGKLHDAVRYASRHEALRGHEDWLMRAMSGELTR